MFIDNWTIKQFIIVKKFHTIANFQLFSTELVCFVSFPLKAPIRAQQGDLLHFETEAPIPSTGS